MPVGRPPKWETVEEVEKLIQGYFEHLKETPDEVPDVEGLAYYMDTTRKTILDYENKEEFSYTIKKAKDKIFYFKKQAAFKGKIHPTIFIFDSKNNHGYTDKQEIESTNKNLNIEVDVLNMDDDELDKEIERYKELVK